MGVDTQLYYFFNLGATWGSAVNATLQPLYPRERDIVPILQRIGGPSSRAERVAKNFAQTGVRSATRPAHTDDAISAAGAHLNKQIRKLILLSALQLFINFVLLNEPFQFISIFCLLLRMTDFHNFEILLYIFFSAQNLCISSP